MKSPYWNEEKINFTCGNTWLGSELLSGWWTLHGILSIKYLKHFSWYFLIELYRTAAAVLKECDKKHLSQAGRCCSWNTVLYSSSNSQSLRLLLTGNVCDQKIRKCGHVGEAGVALTALNLFIKCLNQGVGVSFFQLCYHSGLLHNSCIWQCSQIWLWLVKPCWDLRNWCWLTGQIFLNTYLFRFDKWSSVVPQNQEQVTIKL